VGEDAASLSPARNKHPRCAQFQFMRQIWLILSLIIIATGYLSAQDSNLKAYSITKDTLSKTTKTGDKANLETDQYKTIYVTNVEPEREKSTFDTAFTYIKEILGPLVALIGILLAIPILKKKLVENHISTALTKIQDCNKLVQKKGQELTDKYLPLTYSSELLRKNEVNKAFEDIKKLYYLSQDGSSDVVSLLFYLKATVQGTLKHYDSKIFLTSRTFYGFIIDILQTTDFYCSQVVQIPKSTATETSHLINKKLRKYVTHSDFIKYQHFYQGVIDDPHSAHYTIFYGKVNEWGINLMKRAAFQIYFNSSPIKKLLYLNELYAPTKIEMLHDDPFFGSKSLKVFLIGFKLSTQMTLADSSQKLIVELIYSNPDDFHRFASNLKFEMIKDKFKDTSLDKSTFDLSKASKMTSNDFETFSLVFSEDYLRQQFKSNKGKFRKSMMN